MSKSSEPTIVMDVSAAYNRENLPMPQPNGPHGERQLNIEMLMEHPFYWEWLNEHEAEEVMRKLYNARTKHGQ